MPHFINNKISRKSFLKRSLKIGGFLATYGIVYENAIGAKSNKSFHVALIHMLKLIKTNNTVAFSLLVIWKK